MMINTGTIISATAEEQDSRGQQKDNLFGHK